MTAKKNTGKGSSSRKSTAKTSSARQTRTSSRSKTQDQLDREAREKIPQGDAPGADPTIKTKGGRGVTGDQFERAKAKEVGARESVHQSPKNTGPGADPRGGSGDQFHQLHGRYRDEVIDNPEKESFIVRRTFLASKTEFEVTVPKAGLGKSVAELNRLQRGEREQMVKDAAKVALDLRTDQMGQELDNSELGGKSIAQAKGNGGTFNPENPYAPRGQLGASPDLQTTGPAKGSSRGKAPAGEPGIGSGEATREKGMGARSSSTGQPETKANIKGSPNDRTATAGSAKSADTVREVTD